MQQMLLDRALNSLSLSFEWIAVIVGFDVVKVAFVAVIVGFAVVLLATPVTVFS